MVPLFLSRIGRINRCVRSTRALMLSWIISSSRLRSSLTKSPIDPNPALLMSISISSPRFCVSSRSCAAASGCSRSRVTYCARMLVKRPSSLQSAISLSSERATSSTFLPRAASFLAKAAPIPDEAPVMRVVFIYKDEETSSLQFKQVELDDISAACFQFPEGLFCRRIVQVDASHCGRRPFKYNIFHFLNVDLFRFDRVKHTGQHARSIEMTNHQPVRRRSLTCKIYYVRHLTSFFELS